jgi:ABC-type sugar transport system permease subunit
MSIGPTMGLLMASLLNGARKMQAFFRTAFFMPVMTSLVVVSTIWIMLYNRSGIFNTILNLLGLQTVAWLSNPHWALFSVIIASVWQGFGFETVIFLAAIQGIPKELYEAARIDGAGAGALLWNITLPSLRPVILFVYIYGIIGSYQIYDQIYVMTQGGPVYTTTTLVYYLLNKFQNLQLGYASAIAYVLFVILIIFSFLQYRFFSDRG